MGCHAGDLHIRREAALQSIGAFEKGQERGVDIDRANPVGENRGENTHKSRQYRQIDTMRCDDFYQIGVEILSASKLRMIEDDRFEAILSGAHDAVGMRVIGQCECDFDRRIVEGFAMECADERFEIAPLAAEENRDLFQRHLTPSIRSCGRRA